MKVLLHYELQIYMLLLWLNYCSIVQGRVKMVSQDYVPRIWNGEPAKLGQFPYQVGLMTIIKPRYKGVYGTFCGGAIIGRSRVLTAAHCLVPDDTRSKLEKMCCNPKPVMSRNVMKGLRIVAGNIDSFIYTLTKTTATYQWRSISRYNFPPKYDFPELDICVITTQKPWDFNENVGSLPYASKHIDYGDITCTASGFGLLNKDQRNPIESYRLMWANLELAKDSTCKKKHKTQMKDFICTDNKKKDVTQGDSGGPLVCKNTGDPREQDKGIIVGVVCGESKYGNFFTRVSSYTTFVDSAHKKACSQFCFFIGLLGTILS